MTSVFGHCRDSFWTVQFNLEVFVNLGVGLLEHKVQNWSSRLIIGAHGWELELTVQIWSTRFTFWSSRFGFGAHGSTGKHHDLLFLGHAMTRVFGNPVTRVFVWQGFFVRIVMFAPFCRSQKLEVQYWLALRGRGPYAI